jgi:hypothetical protein
MIDVLRLNDVFCYLHPGRALYAPRAENYVLFPRYRSVRCAPINQNIYVYTPKSCIRRYNRFMVLLRVSSSSVSPASLSGLAISKSTSRDESGVVVRRGIRCFGGAECLFRFNSSVVCSFCNRNNESYSS